MKDFERLHLERLLANWIDMEGDERHIHEDMASGDLVVFRDEVSCDEGAHMVTVWRSEERTISVIGLDALQGTVQEMIQELTTLRGYSFCLKSAADGYHAQIEDGARIWQGKSNKAAVALLEAYVECLNSLECGL